jgi:multicomponent Na+:H+ antiporter subunit G
VSLLGWGLLLLGAALLAVAALGVLRLPGALAKQHAATKAATLALGVMVLGVAALYPDAAWWGRLALLIAVLLATLPLASHALARAAATQERDRNGEPD